MSILGRDADDGWWDAFGNVASWSTRSVKDPRFDMSGTASGVIAASLVMDEEIRARAKALGVEPPDDIEVSAWKS